MRRNGWILSMVGAAGLTFGQLQAGDPLAEQLAPPTSDPRAESRASSNLTLTGDAASSPSQQRSLFSAGSEASGLARQPTRYRRGVESQVPESDLRNYYRELFGEQPALSKNMAPPAQPLPGKLSAAPGASDANKVVGPIPEATLERASFGSQIPTSNPLTKPQTTPANANPAETSGEVVHASLQQSGAESVNKGIQPVSGELSTATGATPSPAARPFPSSLKLEAAPPAASSSVPLPASNGSPSLRPEAAPVDKLSPSPQERLSGQSSIHLQPQQRLGAEQESPFQRPNTQNELTRPISIVTPSLGAEAPIPTTDRRPHGGGLMLTGGAATSGAAGVTAVSHAEVRPMPIATLRSERANAAAAAGVTLQWLKRGELNVGQECACELIVKNAGQSVAEDVEVEAYFPKTVRLTAAEPTPEASTEFLGWEFDSLHPGEQRTITIKLIPMERGDVATEAHVRFTGRSVSSFTVTEPMLELKLEGPTDVMIGGPASHRIIVSNPGTGVATDVRLLAMIPPGLEHAGGERIELTIGSLNPGESRPVSLPLIATAGGRHLIEIQARADAGLTRKAATEVAVVAPSLQAAIDGPGLRYVGRQAVYTISVNNTGAAATDNVRVMYKVPEGLSFIGSDRGTHYDPSTRMLSWFVGRLEKAQTLQLHVTLSSDRIGDFTHLVRATSEYGATSDAQFKSSVEGTPSLAVEVADLDDPVEVGAEAAYEVHVKNEGSAPAQNVLLACELAGGMTFQKAAGPGRYNSEGSVVRFEPIPQLAPGEQATFRVIVSCEKAGNLRMKAHVSSESIPEPLTSEELTKFYGE